jgi:VWFA-related protein
MKKLSFFFGVLFLCLFLFPQEIFKEQSMVINVEVPVRVFDGGKFVDSLSIDDFEVFEDGELQKIVAVYQVSKKTITRKEEKKKFKPETSRNFYLFFQITEYSPRIEEALDYFIQNVLTPGDNLIVVTPMKSYSMQKNALEVKAKEEIVNQLKGLLRKDAMMGSAEYRAALDDLKELTVALASVLASEEGVNSVANLIGDIGSTAYKAFGDNVRDVDDAIDILFQLYPSVLEKLEQTRHVDQYKLLEFARFLKYKEGQKYVFLFYQREFTPQIDSRLLNQTLGVRQDMQNVTLRIAELVDMYKREVSIDIDKVKQTYADSSASIHFMFFTKPARYLPGIQFIEHSEDIYASFKEMAKATGGTTESSSNPGFLFKKAVESSESYYLLYYSPRKYLSDGKFKKITVRVKGKNYRITHRAGYFAE